jgi:hypothetical protein
MFKEGNRGCIDNLLTSSKFVLDSGLSIRNESYDKRQALWNEIKANDERYHKGDCGKFLPDLAVHFQARFDASLLLLALVFQQNREQFEGSGYFNNSEIEAYETIEKFSYFRILSKNDIAKKIRSKDEKILTLLKDYSVSMKPRMDEILGDVAVRDSIRSHLKKQWDENTKKVGEAIAIVSTEDPDWFTRSPMTTKEKTEATQTIINIAGNYVEGNVVQDSVVTGSDIKSSGGGGSMIKDSVITRSTIESSGEGSPESGVKISDSVITSSKISISQETPSEPEKESASQPTLPICLLCSTVAKSGSKFCTTCGAKISIVCAGCRSVVLANEKFCAQCGKKTS